MSRLSMFPVLAICIPPAIAFVFTMYLLVGWAAGWQPFWPIPPLTPSEAVFVRDRAELLRLIRLGDDPERAWPVAPGLVKGHPGGAMTPLDAAVETRQPQFVELLLREGVRLTPEARAELIGRAERLDAPEIAEYLRSAE